MKTLKELRFESKYVLRDARTKREISEIDFNSYHAHNKTIDVIIPEISSFWLRVKISEIERMYAGRSF